MAIVQDLGYQSLDIGIFGEATHVEVSDLQHWRRESARITRDLSTTGQPPRFRCTFGRRLGQGGIGVGLPLPSADR